MTEDTAVSRLPERASNALVLAPISPAGNRAYLELLTAMAAPAETNVAAITYTQPPNTWLRDWQEQNGQLPGELAFIHANGAQSADEMLADITNAESIALSVSRVDPSEPMDIIAPLTETLTRWAETPRQTVVSVQTLTLLLEYVDFETAFRFLHLITQRMPDDAIGFYQMDPEIHSAETINTLKSLFDVVVEFDDDWTVTETFVTDASTRDQAAQQTADDGSDQGLRGALTAVIDQIAERFQSDSEPASAEEASVSQVDTADVSPESMLTAEELICQKLTEYGGRMKQGDVVTETEWSKSKVSRELSRMEKEAVISRIQIGREKVVFLAGYEPEAVRSNSEEMGT